MIKFAFYPLSFLLIFLLFQGSNGSNNLIRESCRSASKDDPNITYNFCVASLEAICESQPTSLEELVGISIQMTKSNATNMVSNISKLLKDQKFSDYVKDCLKDCFDLYSDSLSDLEDAMGAYRSKDLDTVNTKISAALDASATCEDQFDDQGEKSPLTEDNNDYSQLNSMSLAFIQMSRQHS